MRVASCCTCDWMRRLALPQHFKNIVKKCNSLARKCLGTHSRVHNIFCLRLLSLSRCWRIKKPSLPKMPASSETKEQSFEFCSTADGLIVACGLIVAYVLVVDVKHAPTIAALAAVVWMAGYWLVWWRTTECTAISNAANVPAISNAANVPAISNAHESLEEAVTLWLGENSQRQLKVGDVFAASRKDQLQLNAIQYYLDQKTMARPLIGQIPLKLSGSVEHEVNRHVCDGEAVGDDGNRTSLLCNSGTSGCGKTTLLQQTTVEVVRKLKTMVDEHVESSEADNNLQWRPLGFYVTFNNHVTPDWADPKYLREAEEFPILTAIALRMVYSVVVPPKMTVGSALPPKNSTLPLENVADYGEFARRIASHCDMVSDAENFDRIVGALRTVLRWEGPMFIAIDEFKKPSEFRPPQERILD